MNKTIKSKLIVICSMIFLGCELFSGPKVDLFQKISDEVDWAAAKKLTLRINYPPAWGESNPQRGNITPVRDLRKGYAFEIEFTPNMAYTLTEWRAYRTSDLDTVSGKPGQPGNWVENPSLITTKEPLGPGDVTLPAPNPSGGMFKFTIHTTEPVTLVPLCKTQPRIIRTEPLNTPDGEPYPQASDIVIYFNSALAPGTAAFASGASGNGIWITEEPVGGGSKSGINGKFNAPVYAAIGGFFTVTISPTTTLPDVHSLISVELRGITNPQGDKMPDDYYKFSWKTPGSTTAAINSWTAAYNHTADTNSGSIDISWTQTNADRIEVYYRLNNGSDTPLSTSTESSDTAAINNVSGPDDSGVGEGRQVSGIREYEIYIALYVSGIKVNLISFKIWNIPAMSINQDNRAVEVTSVYGDFDESDRTVSFANITIGSVGAGKQYVLAQDLTITSAWTPIGSGSGANAFQGKFYGAGRTITVNGGFADAEYTGVFGYVEGSAAEIRDVSVQYGANATAGASVIHIGGLAGYAGGGAKLRNIIVRSIGNSALSYSGSEILFFGGIAGELNGAGTQLENAYGSLNLNFSSSTGAYIGGIAGYTDNATITNCVWAAGTNLNVAMCDGVLYAGGIIGKFYSTFTSDDDSTPSLNNAVSLGNISVNDTRNDLHLGGLAGQVSAASTAFIKIENARYETGIINAVCYGGVSGSNRSNSNIGGLIGTIGVSGGKGPDMSGCSTKAAGINVSYLGSGDLNLGGFAGYVRNTDIITGGISDTPITVLKSGDVYDIMVGGFIGQVYFSGNTTITGSRSSASITIEGKPRHELNTGGLIGYVARGGGSGTCTIEECSASGDQFIKTYSVSISGGLISYTNNTTIRKCRADGNVRVQVGSIRNNNNIPPYGSNGDYLVSGGGLIGYAAANTKIEDCYALGNVEVDDPYITAGTYRNEADAGGLVGRTINNSVSISRCFAKGMVTAQALPLNSKSVCAGGIVGYRNGGAESITNCVALNDIISTRGGNTRSTNRITNAASALVSNYARDTMRLEEWTTYGNPLTAQPVSVTPPGSTTDQHGGDVTATELVTWAWWSGTAGFNPVGNSAWSSTGIGRGYPRLAWEF